MNSVQVSAGKALQVEGKECAKSLWQELTGLTEVMERSFDEDSGKEIQTSTKKETGAGLMGPGMGLIGPGPRVCVLSKCNGGHCSFKGVLP